jgi:transcriptional regulator with XRE-family HTH domain
MTHRLIRLAELRNRKNLTQSEMAAIMGVSQPAYQRWETGKREPNLDQIIALADKLGVSVSSLLGQLVAAPLGPTLFIQGSVAAGIWRDALEYPREDWLAFNGRADIVANPANRFGLRVEGDSMDQVYPPGTIIECLSVYDSADLKAGKRVVVTRTNASGEIEATVKELAEQGGEFWLVPKSNNPAHSSFKLDTPDEGIVEVKIIAVVVASIRPE